MPTDNKQADETTKKESQLSTEGPLSERDEVKQAENRTQELQKKAQDPAETKKDEK